MNNRIDFIQLGLLKKYLSSEFSVLKNKKLSDGTMKEAYEGLQRIMHLHVDDSNLRSILADLPTALAELGLGSGSTCSIAERAWTQCTNLAALSLHSSSLTHQPFPKAAFHSLTSLHMMKMNFSQLRSIHSHNSPSCP